MALAPRSALRRGNQTRNSELLVIEHTTTNEQNTYAIERHGFALVRAVVDEEAAAALLQALDAPQDGKNVRRRGGVYALRNLLDVSAIRNLVRAPAIRALVEPILGPDSFAVRGILFDKTPDANWKVAWHQDLSLAVRERAEVAGWGPWSEKAGVTHVQPPAAILERMLTLRLHLDDCGGTNGPLRVLPGSHQHGRLNAQAIRHWRDGVSDVPCFAKRGDVLLMRPLLLHASSPSQSPEHRRVIHLEWAAEPLPNGLHWHDREAGQ